ncbi:PHB depolymerase family esterase [Thalassobacillus sp. CUG 92003]|uniref:alpha/beta hydrolase family esterase n=1 Tax=Thalassobacillus sp. CUG 92003 TaxID=2736641 RepID=UPI0015E75EFE|nr:PHB depolymerase family esterase [Thalassobacillus sp. CUG 92003]
MKTYTQTLATKDGQRTFYYACPDDVTRGERLPLVFCFHGAGSSAKEHMAMTRFHHKVEEENIIVVFPEAIQLDAQKRMSKQWNEGRAKNPVFQHGIDDEQFVMDMIDFFKDTINVDDKRIFVTGFSNGSAFSLKLALRYQDVFAGVGGVAGPVVKDSAERTNWRRPMPLIFFMGEKDPVVPYDGVFHPPYVIDQLLSAEETAAHFAQSLTAPLQKRVEELDAAGPGFKQTFSGREGDAVVFYSMEEAGHTWPGGPMAQETAYTGKVNTQLDATSLMWEHLKETAVP